MLKFPFCTVEVSPDVIYSYTFNFNELNFQRSDVLQNKNFLKITPYIQ